MQFAGIATSSGNACRRPRRACLSLIGLVAVAAIVFFAHGAALAAISVTKATWSG